MVRRVGIGNVVFGITVLIVSHSCLKRCGPAFGQEVSNDVEAAIKEYNRLWDQANKLLAAGKTAEAIAVAETMLSIERKALPAGHANLVGLRNWLAYRHLEREDFAAASTTRREVLEILRNRHGETHWEVTDARLALEDVDRLQGMTHDQKEKVAEANRLNGEVLALHRAGRFGEALNSARRILVIRKAVLGVRHPHYATSLNNLAFLLYLRGDYAVARSLHEQALAIRKAVLGDRHPDYAQSLNNLALLLQAQGNYAAARPLYEQALAIRKAALGERHPEYATSLSNLAGLLQAQGDYAAARPLYEQALAIRKAVLGDRHPDYAQSLNNLALLLQAQGDYAAAKPLYEQALAITKVVLGERHPDYTRILSNLAGLRHSQGDYTAARSLYEQALAINKAILGERHPDYATGLSNLAFLLKEQGDYAAARPLYEQALAITKAVLSERHPEYATSLSNLAGLLQAQGDYAAARPLFEQALAVTKAILGERHPDYATSLNNLAFLLKAEGDYAASRLLYEQALTIRKAVLGKRHSDYATSLSNLAGLLDSQGDYAAARPLYEQALAITKAVLGERHPDYARSLNNLAWVLDSRGDYAGARPLYEQSLAITKAVLGERHLKYASSLSNLGVLLWELRDYSQAALRLKQALEITEDNLGLAAVAQSERQQLAMAQELRGHLDVYLSLALMAKLAPGDAYHHVLASKGAILERQRRLRVLRRRFQSDPNSQAARRFADYEQVVKQLSALALVRPNPKEAQAWHEELAELARNKDALEAELVRLDAGFRVERAQSSITPDQLQATLPRGTAFLDLLVYTAIQPPAEGKGAFQAEISLIAFAVRPDRPIARIELGPIAPIQKAIDEWRPILGGGKAAAAANDPAMTLRRLIWEPVEPQLEGIQSVLISPDGPLGQIPLAALPGKAPNSYLIEERSIALVPVPRMLGLAATIAAQVRGSGALPGEPAPSLLLAGEIDYGGEPGKGDGLAMRRSAPVGSRAGLLPDFGALRETRAEILAVRDSFEERFSEGAVKNLRKAEATEEALRRKAPRHRFLHLATHGYFAPESLRSALGPGDPKSARPGIDTLGGIGVTGYHPGLLSGIALAGANCRPTPIGQDDGILTAMEVAELDLSGVELAVLSACETGLGAVAGGEGLLGLQRAFQVAGAHSVVASLWTVDDEATRSLMTRFYENLWRKGQPPAEALREAQLSMLRGSLWRGTLKRETDGSKSDRLPPLYWAAFVLSTDRIPTQPGRQSPKVR